VIVIEFAEGVGQDFARIADHLRPYEVADIEVRIAEIAAGFGFLKQHPEIGRRIGARYRELVLGEDSRGYLGKYLYLRESELILVTAIRSQRELRYQR
jgi:toxin ParE1/3/4